MSANVKDLISQMLTFEPEVRPSGNELLNHEWFNLRNQDSKILHTDVIQRLNNFHVDALLM